MFKMVSIIDVTGAHPDPATQPDHPSAEAIPAEVLQAIEKEMSTKDEKSVSNELYIWDFAGQVRGKMFIHQQCDIPSRI